MSVSTNHSHENPASVISQILDDFHKQHRDLPALEALGNCMGVKATHSLSNFETLVDDLESSVKALNIRKQRESFKAVGIIRDFIAAFNYNTKVSELQYHLQGNLFSLLEKCSLYLSGNNFEIQAPILEELQRDIEDLRDQVMESDLDGEIAEFIHSTLDNLSRAIQDYRFRGNKGLSDSVELSIGRYFIHKDEMSKQDDKGYLNKVFSILSRVLTVLNITNVSSTLAEKVFKLLPPSKD
jgi:hypothetical protein